LRYREESARLARGASRAGRREALLNRSGTTFRKLADSEKQNLDRDRSIDRLVVGFKPELYKSLKW
jgi:hypothetical protein